MTVPNGPSDSPKHPTSEDLAGIPFEAEGHEDTTIKPCPSWVSRQLPLPKLTGKPTPVDLAGIPFEAQGKEDNTIRPRRRKGS
jgi:hypothetical protein